MDNFDTQIAIIMQKLDYIMEQQRTQNEALQKILNDHEDRLRASKLYRVEKAHISTVQFWNSNAAWF